MKEAVIVSTARTGLTKSHRGSFNNLEMPSMAAPVLQAVIERAGVEPGEVEDLGVLALLAHLCPAIVAIIAIRAFTGIG